MDAQWFDDPTGRMKYRWWDGQGFTIYTSHDGKSVSLDISGLDEVTSHPVTYQPVVKPPGVEQTTSAAKHFSWDNVGAFLEVVGWILLVLSVLAGVVIGSESASGYDGTPLPGFLVGAVGGVQSLLLVGFGRLIQSNHRAAYLLEQSADLQQRTVELLERAVNQSEQG